MGDRSFATGISKAALGRAAAVRTAAAVLGLVIAGAQAQTSRNMTQLAKWNPPGTVSSSAGIWGHTDANGKEYALFTTRRPGGLSIVDISTPIAPKQVNFIASTGNSIWQEVHSFRKTAYKVSQENSDGLQIIDLSPLDRGLPAVLVKSTTQWFKVAHTLFIDTTTAPARLFVAYENTAGVMIFSLADPHNPAHLRTIAGETHDMFARGDRLYASNQFKSTVTIWNIANLAASAPVKIGVIDLSQVSQSKGEPIKGISHNAWPSEDDKYLFTTEETTGNSVKAFDITNFSLTNPPKLVGTYIGVKNIIAHNVYIKGSLMFVAHYTAGVRVVDVSDPANMREIAFHRPSTSNDLYGGSWGVYPWFQSGNFIHGDDVQGLFVEKLDALPGSARERAGKARFTITPLADGRIDLSLAEGGAYVLSVFAPSGRELFNLPGNGKAGLQTLTLGAGGLAPGQYVVRLRQGGWTASAPLAHR